MLRKLKFYNTVSRIFFLILTPVLFRVLNFAFIWHSIYWGVITFVVLIWMFFILIAPLFGRIGCGWLCFMGTVQDLNFNNSLFKIKQRKPILWLRLFLPVAFFASSITFLVVHFNNGTVETIRFIPNFFGTELNTHYQHVWFYDTFGAILLGILLEKRWACKNLCFMGALCAAGATYSRLIPVVDTANCNHCRKCEQVCLTAIPILEYVEKNNGLVTHSECILCGKCVDACSKNALQVKFVWNRNRFKANAIQKLTRQNAGS